MMPADTRKRDCACPRAQHQHGTLGAYQYDGCRCFPCCLNRSRAHDAYSAGQPWLEYDWRPAVGVARRLQALTAIGWSDAHLADRLDLHRSYVVRLRADKNSSGDVTPATYDAVARVYDDLWDTPYIGPYSSRTKRLAARKGWAPPLAWDDDAIDDPHAQPADSIHIASDPTQTSPFVRHGRTPLAARIAADNHVDQVAVERAIHGDPVNLTPSEVSQVIRTMTGMGHSASQIADRLRLSERTVQRWRDQGHAA